LPARAGWKPAPQSSQTLYVRAFMRSSTHPKMASCNPCESQQPVPCGPRMNPRPHHPSQEGC